MPKLVPHDAYAAWLDDKGNVMVAGLENPDVKTTVIVEFDITDDDDKNAKSYHAIYHNDNDQWEVFGEEEWFVADTKNEIEFYLCANRVVDQYSHKLLNGPCPKELARRLTKAMASEMTREIDREILIDLYNASNTPIPASLSRIPSTLTITPPLTPRTLKATWSMDTSDLKTQFHNPNLRSRLIGDN